VAVADKIKQFPGVKIMNIALGNQTNIPEILKIVTKDQTIFQTYDIGSVPALLGQIVKAIYEAQPLQTLMTVKADVIYVVDSSEHVGTSLYNEILKLLANVAKSFYLGQDGLRLAEIVYGKESLNVIDLGNSLSPTEMATKILSSPFIGGETLAHQGLQMAYDMISYKSRKGVPVFVIHVTDGYSADPEQTRSSADKIKQIPGVVYMAVAAGDHIEVSEVQKLVGDSKHIFKASDASSVSSLASPIVNTIYQVQVPLPTQLSTLVDLIFVVDSSNHVNPLMFNEILKLLTNVAKSFTIGKNSIRLAHIVYGKETRKVFDLDNSMSPSEIAKKILTSPYINGETLTHQGLQLAYDTISSKRRSGVPVYVVLVNDGYSVDSDQTVAVADKIKQFPGVKIMNIALGNQTNIPEILKIVTKDQTIFQTYDIGSVPALLGQIVKAIYEAQPLQTLMTVKADVIYVVDSSEHVGTSLYNEILKLLANVAKSFNFGQNGLRLAEIVYGKESRNVIDLDNSLSPTEIATKILSSPFIGGETLAHQGLQMAYDMISYKSRKGVPVFVIHVTDGYSADPEQTRSSADKIKQIPGVVYMAVAAGDHIEVSEVQKLVGDSKHIFKASDASSVSSLASPIVNSIYQVQVPLPTQLSTLVDLIFVVDSSNHVNPLMFNEILKLLTNVAKSFTIGKNSIRLSHIVYGKETRKVFDLDNSMSPSEIAKKILTSPYINGETLTHQALQLAYDTISSKRRSGVPVYVILVNDGYSVDSEQTVAVADKIKQFPGVKIMNIALGFQTNIPEILKIVTKDQTIFQTYDIGSVPALLDQIVKAIFEAQPLSALMTVKADVIYVVDSSEHVGTSLYNEILKLLANVAKSFHLGQDGLRLAEIVYGKESRKVFDLDNSLSPSDIAIKILSSPFIGGETLAHQGLQMVYDMISYKSRKGVPVFVIHVTDGYSADPEQTRSNANKIKQIPGVNYMTVAAGGQIDLPELQKLASYFQNIFTAYDTSSFGFLLYPIVNRIYQSVTTSIVSPTRLTLTTVAKPQLPMQTQYTIKADVIYVVDASERVDRSVYGEIQKLLANVASDFKLGQDGLRLAEIVYGKESRKVFDLDNSLSPSQLATKILTSPYIGGETLTHQGLQLAYDMISSKRRYGVPVYVILVTDGYSSQPDQTASNCDKIKQTPGVSVFSVAVGGQINVPELQKLISDHQPIFQAPDTGYVTSLRDPIVNHLCSVKPTTKETTAKNAATTAKTSARPSTPTTSATSTPTTSAPSTPTTSATSTPTTSATSAKPPTTLSSGCSSKADVIYVVDASERVDTSLYNEILKLLSNVTKSLNLGQDGFRLAEIVYGKESQKVLDLDNSLSSSEIVKEILSSPYIGGETLAHQGLQMAIDMISYKSRKGVPVIVILVTDGYSSEPDLTYDSDLSLKRLPSVSVMAVAAGDQIDTRELQRLISDSQTIFKASNNDQVAALSDQIVRTLCQYS
ncbi:hypothetical protein Btru_051002, partial [Bulinus truncatus]